MPVDELLENVRRTKKKAQEENLRGIMNSSLTEFQSI
jgi:hypothetical protein